MGSRMGIFETLQLFLMFGMTEHYLFWDTEWGIGVR